jgi:hypothetical protein
MSPSARQIEREVEASRAHVEETVEALKDKMSLGQIVDEAARYFTASGGPQAMANLGAQVRDNPLPLALVGVGLAWLMSGRGQPHLRSRRELDYGRGYDPDFDGDGRRYAGAPYPDYTGAADIGDEWGAGDGSNESGDGRKRRGARDVRDAAAAAASAVGSAAESVASGVGAAASSIGGAAKGAGSTAYRAGRSAYSTAGYAAGGVRHGADAAWRGGSGAYRQASRFGTGAYDSASRLGRAAYGGADRLGHRARDSVSGLLETEPLVLGALGLAVGAALGALLPRTETEDRYFGETRDRLRDDAAVFARERLDEGREVAKDVYRAAASEAEAQGLTPDGLSERIGEVASATMQRAKESAEQHGWAERGDLEPMSGETGSTEERGRVSSA